MAREAGLPGAQRAMDARDLPEDEAGLQEALEAHAVFGRVQPHQKRQMVRALQASGHTVAMTGDGVNDVLALKDADMGIAMGSGSSASRAAAQLVLLDGSFATLPAVVSEGRRVINNVERVANLFLVKTTYSMLLAIAVGVAHVPFPFLPRHLTLVGSLTIGIPAFFLALAPNDHLARSGFVPRVLRFAVPAGTLAAIVTYAAYALARDVFDLTLDQSRTLATLVLVGAGLVVLVRLAQPLTAWRAGLVMCMIGLFAAGPDPPRRPGVLRPGAAAGGCLRRRRRLGRGLRPRMEAGPPLGGRAPPRRRLNGVSGTRGSGSRSGSRRPTRSAGCRARGCRPGP